MSDMNADLDAALTGLAWLPVVAAAALALLYATHRWGLRPASRAWAAITAASPRVHALVAAILVTSAVHLALTPAHLDEAPVLGVLFALSAAAGAAVCAALYVRLPGASLAASALLVSLVAGYAITRLVGFEEWDALGLATKAVELAGLGLVVPSALRELGRVPARAGHGRVGSDAERVVRVELDEEVAAASGLVALAERGGRGEQRMQAA